MIVARYLASLGVQIEKKDTTAVDKFLTKFEKDLKTSAKSTDTLEKAVKKETKTTVDGLVQKEQKQKALNKQITVAAKNQKAWNTEFAYSLKMMTSKPLSKAALKTQQGVYDQLFGAITPKAMIGATGSNQRAWNTRFKQQIAGMSATSGISRRARQEQLEAAFGAVGSNPRVANMLNQRMSHLGGGKSDTLADMAAYYRNEQKVAALKERVSNQEEASTRRILALRQRELAREERTRQKMAQLEGMSYARAWNQAYAEDARRTKQAQQPQQAAQRGQVKLSARAGAFARYGIGSLPFIGGVYGLSQVNTVSQELQANQLALKAVAGEKAGGYSEFLNNLGNRLGMTTRDLQPGFTQYLASAQGTALEPTIQKDFTNFAQYGAVMGLGPEEMKGSLKAVTQMVSKQQIYAEELKGQLAERMPAAVRMMADAVTGGDTKALLKMMEDGKLDPNEALPKFFEEMRKRSESMLPEYFKTSRFAQGSMNKAAEDSLKVFASEGGDKGFTNFFNRMTEAMKAAQPLIKALAGSFEDLTKVLQAPIYMFDRMNQTLTILSQTTGIAEKNFTNLAIVGGLMMTKWGRVGMIFTTMLVALEDISMGVSGEGDSFTGRFIKWMEESGVVMGPFEKGLFGVSAGMLAIAAALKAISVSTSLPGIGDVFGKSGGTGKDGKPTKGSKGWAGKLFNYAVVPALLAGGYYLGSGMGDDPALDQYGYKDVTKMQQMQYTSPSLGGQLMSTGTGFRLGGLLGAAGGAAYGSLGNYVPYNPSESSSLNLDLLMSEMVRIREAAGLVSDARSAGAFGPLNPKININSGAIVINANTSDPEALSEILMSKLKDQTNYLITGQYTEALVHFP